MEVKQDYLLKSNPFKNEKILDTGYGQELILLFFFFLCMSYLASIIFQLFRYSFKPLLTTPRINSFRKIKSKGHFMKSFYVCLMLLYITRLVVFGILAYIMLIKYDYISQDPTQFTEILMIAYDAP